MNPLWWLLIPAAYLLGSVSFAWICGRLKGIDLRQHGSGNLGATNAGRVLGWKWFALVMVLDLLKGLAPVLVSNFAHDDWLRIATALAAVIGHVFTCFHGFKGGKAVATSLGVIIGLAPPAAGIIFLTWVSTWALVWKALRLSRSDAVGPASIVAAAAVVPAYLLTARPTWQAPTLGFIALLAALVLIKHRSNFAKFVRQLRERKAATP